MKPHNKRGQFKRDRTLGDDGIPISKKNLRQCREYSDKEEELPETKSLGSSESEESENEHSEIGVMSRAVVEGLRSEGDSDPVNPNHGAEPDLEDAERRKKKQKRKDKLYWQLHLQGKTNEAKADLARLSKIRAERDAAQAARLARKNAKAVEVLSNREQSGSSLGK